MGISTNKNNLLHALDDVLPSGVLVRTVVGDDLQVRALLRGVSLQKTHGQHERHDIKLNEIIIISERITPTKLIYH